jgi:hypothetical protein
MSDCSLATPSSYRDAKMICVSKGFVFLVLLTAVGSEAQVAGPIMSLGSPALSQLAPNSLVLGSGTSVSYDSNALNSQPPIPNVQYTVFPQIGLNLARPRWDALISFMPGFSYSSANLSEYQAVSLTSSVQFQCRVSPRLSLNFLNSLVSSTNPFDSLISGYQPGQGSATAGTGTALNYLPRMNEVASADLAYSLSARTSLTALASYNYVSYQHDSGVDSAAQPFQQSNSAQVSMGLQHNSSLLYQGSVLYLAQLFDSGQGLIKTFGQSVQYALQYSPRPTLRLSAMIGPEYVQNSYGGSLGTGVGANLVNQRASGWSWTGDAATTWTRGMNQLSVSVSKHLGLGTQYQGNVEEVVLQADFHRRLPRRSELTMFGGYNINTPVSLARSIPRFSNNYFSVGAALNKTIGGCWVIGFGYWNLQQNSPRSGGDPYSGNHNRVAMSLSYSITKPLRK